MGYLRCNAESAVSTCDSYNFHPQNFKQSVINPPPITIREFPYSELTAATNNFSPQNLLGKGSHGSVYKAILDHGKLIAAVKRTLPNSGFHTCSNCNNNPADNEIEILSRVHHPRLVNLIGFCSDKKLIVVEYMTNGNLYHLLHESLDPPGWNRRLQFALQIAKAIQVLHSSNPPVIHRDIKSSNVLIDKRSSARLGDFGLALRGHVEDVRVKCTPPAGTIGYLDPGYLEPSDLSTKSDVFSFGILLLEIMSGRNAIDLNYSPPSVIDWALPLIKGGSFVEICDVRIRSLNLEIARKLAILAARCVRATAAKRPSMTEVVQCLKVAKKKSHELPIWDNCRRQVDIIPAAVAVEAFEESEKVGKVVRRRSRKVSSIPNIENVSTLTFTNGVSRSRSTVVKMVAPAVVRLGKSNSTGSPRVMSRFYDVFSEKKMEENPLFSF